MNIAERPSATAGTPGQIRNEPLPGDLRRNRAALGLAGLFSLALAAIAAFDLGPPIAFNDDYAYAWSARHLWTGPIYPAQTALALPQIVLGWLLSLPFAHDQRALRLSVLALLLPACWAAYRIARRLGAGQGWALLAPVAMVSSPIFFNLSVTFMSDVAYVALVLLACNPGVAWLEDERPRKAFVVWATLATLQRLFGLALVVALAATLVLRRRSQHRRMARSEVAWLGLAGLGSVLAAVVPALTGVSAGANVVDRLSHLQVDAVINPLVHLPVVAGYLVLPFAWAVAIAWTRRSVAVALCSAALVLLVLLRTVWLPGNIWTFVGPGPTLGGGKQLPVPIGMNLVLIALSATVFVLIGPAASQRWASAAKADSRFAFLMLVAGLQLILLMPNTLTLFDRYYLPVAAPLLPLLAALGQRYSRPGGLWVGAVASLGLLALSTVYELDYQSWQEGRDGAARLAYRCALPDRVNAGYEANAVYSEIPAFEASGKAALGSVSRLLTIYGPPNPVLWLEFSGPDDPRPGVGYGVVTRGKIVLDGDVCPAVARDGAG